MVKKKFSHNEALRFGWQTTRKHLYFFVRLFLTAGLLMVIFSWTATVMMEEHFIFGMILRVFEWFFASILLLGILKILLAVYDQKPFSMRDLFLQYPFVFHYLVGSLFFSFIVFASSLFFLVPGMVVGIRLVFFPYFIFDQGKGPVAALKESFFLTQGSTGNLLLLFFVVFGFNLLGAVCLLVGLLLTVPTTMLAMVFVYRKLLDCRQAVGKAKG